jgi:hypothetical protein
LVHSASPFCLLFGQVTWFHESDIAKGLENTLVYVDVPVDGPCPMIPFTYVKECVVSQQAVVDTALVNSCKCRSPDCMDSDSACGCKVKNGGQFPYTPEGRLTEALLTEDVSKAL